MVSSRVYPSLERKPGGPDNWVEKAGGLPDYIERIAKHLHYEKGMTISRAIATAVSRCKAWAAGRDGASPATQAKAARAIAQWMAKRGKNAVKSATKNLSEIEPLTEFVDVVDLATVSTGFDEMKHNRAAGTGQFAKKIQPGELIAARIRVEGGITNLQVGQTFDLPDKLGWVKRTAGGYFIQGPSGFTASVRTLTGAVQAAAQILAGTHRAPETGKVY